MAKDTPMHTINLCHAQQAAGLHMLLFVFNPPMDKNACICRFHATKQEVYTVHVTTSGPGRTEVGCQRSDPEVVTLREQLQWHH